MSPFETTGTTFATTSDSLTPKYSAILDSVRTTTQLLPLAMKET